jgi:predicted nucleic acid-binding protein
VTITAQLEGQAAAINQQLTSNTIVNVVSKEKIQELPDRMRQKLLEIPGIQFKE